VDAAMAAAGVNGADAGAEKSARSNADFKAMFLASGNKAEGGNGGVAKN
jgi:hypothetical protein